MSQSVDLVLLSGTHGYHGQVVVPGGDVLSVNASAAPHWPHHTLGRPIVVSIDPAGGDACLRADTQEST